MSQTMTVVILPTVAEQEEAGAEPVVDPAVVDLTPWEQIRNPAPILSGGLPVVPEAVMGWWSNPRVVDGRLVADVELRSDLIDSGPFRFSFAGIVGGGQARMIAVHGHPDRKPAEEG